MVDLNDPQGVISLAVSVSPGTVELETVKAVSKQIDVLLQGLQISVRLV